MASTTNHSEIDYSEADGDVIGFRLGESMVAGDTLSYEACDDLGDMVMDDLRRRLRDRGLTLSTEDTEYVEVIEIVSD